MPSTFVSVFAFIIVIGVVVDDAVVIGESIYSNMQSGLSSLDSAADTIARFQYPDNPRHCDEHHCVHAYFFYAGPTGIVPVGHPGGNDMCVCHLVD